MQILQLKTESIFIIKTNIILLFYNFQQKNVEVNIRILFFIRITTTYHIITRNYTIIFHFSYIYFNISFIFDLKNCNLHSYIFFCAYFSKNMPRLFILFSKTNCANFIIFLTTIFVLSVLLNVNVSNVSSLV